MRSARRGLGVAAATALALAALAGTGALPAAAQTVAAEPTADVIVTVHDGGRAAAEEIVTAAGGRIERRLPIVRGFAAEVPVPALPALAALPGVRSVTPNASGQLMSVDPDLGYDPGADEGSLSWIAQLLRADEAWESGFTGQGVDVALIDSGVAPVPGLASGNVVNGPDLSFESQHPDVRYVDTFGHGTHMASIIAGRDVAGPPASYPDQGRFTGIAPDARVVSLKVATADGTADVSQVIAAIDWVAQHGQENGLNIRVLNLSYGTNSTQDAALDPLSYAVEQAWRQGIMVVVAAGNDGTSRQQLADPAINPYVLAVGADDPNGTLDVADDDVPEFAQRGTAERHVDVVAPGVHVLGLRVPNGFIDQAFPAGQVGTRFLRGSGTSQATAVASGVAALILQKYPAATPDQVKYLMMQTAHRFPEERMIWQGLGVLDAAAALAADPADAPVQSHPSATGTGTLEGARGSNHVVLDDVPLTGEFDIFQQAWSVGTATWSGGTYNGTVWTGSDWATDGGWNAATWTSGDWTGTPWTSRTWVSRTWVDNSWDSRTWVDASWSSRTWVGNTWGSRTWVGSSWSGSSWS